MCTILMSINPEYVDKIIAGNKKYEYRKVKAKKSKVSKIVIYCTSPVMQVVAEVDVKNIIEAHPDDLWEQTKHFSGVSKEFYDMYYKNRKTAIAYELGEIKKYEKPKTLEEMGINSIPQSFVYLD